MRARRAVFAAAIAAAALVQPAAAILPPETGTPSQVNFADAGRHGLLLSSPNYELVLSRTNGHITSLSDPEHGVRLVSDAPNGCVFNAVAFDSTAATGCVVARGGFSYAWDDETSTLTLRYGKETPADNSLGATVTIAAAPDHLDFRLTLDSRWEETVSQVYFPSDLVGDNRTVTAGYSPNYLPGVRLAPAFFSRVGNAVQTYPSRWAFADFLAFDADASRFALYAVNPAPNPIAPIDLGFVHDGGGYCSGTHFCLRHVYATWIKDGSSWTSPTVRLVLGEDVEHTMLGYRTDNGIDDYPSLETKVGPLLDTLARAPLIKADLWHGLRPFKEWGDGLRRLPSPAIIHPVSFTPGGHDENDPDFLPPSSQWGSSDDLAGMVAEAHGLGQLVMPYLNVSWWNVHSPTVLGLEPPLTPADISVQRSTGDPVIQYYGPHFGYVVSPASPVVKERVDRLFEEWRSEVPVDCLFFDQIGARVWIRDFNPDEPNPLAYSDGWLALMAPYADRCLMVEDGWDRLAKSFAGFHGGMLLQDRQFDEPNGFYGEGNWRPYPLADWLFHDKVLMYQHDLYPDTMTADLQVLTWNMAFGLVFSYEWDERRHSLDSPWLDLVGSFQRALGPHYAGLPLSDWREPAEDVTESVFGDLTVTANWGKDTYAADKFGIAAGGFLARTRDDSVTACTCTGSFNGSPLADGVHYLLVERAPGSVTVRQPIGPDTRLTLDPPPGWQAARAPQATALDPTGKPFDTVPVDVVQGRFVFDYDASVAGARVGGYVLTSS
jgi:hypothetical protein